MKGVQRDNLEFEFSLVFELDMHHRASISKDRSGVFVGRPEFVITEQTGVEILQWCNAGSEINLEDVIKSIENCNNISALSEVFYQYPQYQNALKLEFSKRKNEILLSQNQTKSELNGSIIK